MTCIVGHGPSMLANTFGARINAHDNVIRLKRSEAYLGQPDQFGTKTDFVCGSWTIKDALQASYPDARVWAFVDSRHDHIRDAQALQWANANNAIVLPKTCRGWNQDYRDLRPDFGPPDLDPRRRS